MSKRIKLSSIIQDDKNFNAHSDSGMALLEKSVDKVGIIESITVSADDKVISGNARHEVISKKFNGTDAIVVETDGTKPVILKRTDINSNTQEFHEAALLANTVAKHNITLDFDIIQEVAIDQYGIDVAELGVEMPIEDIKEAEDDNYEIPDHIETNIVEGDLIEIGPHKLLCGSSTKVDTWDKLMGGELADLVLTDPPYNVDYTGKTKDSLTIQNDKQEDGVFYQFLYEFYTALGAFTKRGGVWYVWHSDSEGANFRKAMKESGIPVRQCLIWVKNSMIMGRQDYHWQHEPCLYGWKEGASHGWYSDRKQTTILNFDKPNRNAEHPTMKPVELIAYQMGNSSKQGDIVADGFGGSGTTMVAAHQMNRVCRMMEIDPKYCQVIVDRMAKLDPNLTIKVNGIIINAEA